MSTLFLMRDMRVRFAGATHVGMKRAHNEDCIKLPEQERLALLADGMGGHASGEVASQLAVNTIADHFRATAQTARVTWPYKIDRSPEFDLHRLAVAIKLANAKIWEDAAKNEPHKGMGTTLVACLFLDDRAVIAHVGDSRVYCIHGTNIEQLTEDHSLLNDYVKMKQLNAAEASRFPHRNVIVRALGMKESVQVDLQLVTPHVGDLFLLCSDGLSGMVEDPEMARLATGEPDLDRACDRLIERANEQGGVDNISVILARIEA